MPAILNDQAIEALLASGVVRVTPKVSLPCASQDAIQPASLDLHLDECAYRLRASFLPGQEGVLEKCKRLTLHSINLKEGTVLETGCIYLIPLKETLALPNTLCGLANPKSSMGRIDVLVRLITEHASAFDEVPAGYQGRLFVEVVPQTFPIIVREFSTLNQLRFVSTEEGEVAQKDCLDILPSLPDLSKTLSVYFGEKEGDLIGYRARRHTSCIDVDRENYCVIEDFWEPLFSPQGEMLILDPGEFYILTSDQSVTVPSTHAADMVPYDPSAGEFRVHYAGFLDPGFGENSQQKSHVVLEVRNHKVPFILEKNQTVARVRYHTLTAMPLRSYNQRSKAHYRVQRLKLSKHFISS